MTIEQVIKKVKENDHGADTDLIRLAYDFALKAHSGQKRKNGEEYIQHSLHTAFILTQIRADVPSIIAGLLHDVPEDTEFTLKDVEKNFGKEVAMLVEGITKLSKIKYRGIERYRESLKKMFLAMAHDLRVILIKFCDRLHNLRTLDALSPEKQQRIAQETMEIFSPIAGLLGIWRLKWQMDDLCFKYLLPEEFKKLEYKYEVEKKLERTQFINKVRDVLGKKFKEEGIENEIEGRFKHLFSIYQKMQKKGQQFDDIYDVFALRIITTSVANCYKILGLIHTIWRPKPNRVKDYIAVPKPNGYRSLHTTVFCLDNKLVEFQIRTKEMNEEAHYGIAAHWYYKQKEGENIVKQPAWIKEILDMQRATENAHDFIKKIKFDVFQDRIFVFSPKGDVFELPRESTPVDFAYAVHTDIGNKAAGAIVNEQITTLDHILKNGDVVNIIIEKNRKTPNKDWLRFVKTARARDKIKQNSAKSTFDSLKKFFPGK
ncbi:MAG: RelA/SpoT family protein [Patescibacteria group bacterium]|nr:RelA/SpoT family protein [Patescibacteria group bacterium]